MKQKFPDLKDAKGFISLMMAFLIVLIIVIFSYMIIFLVRISMQSGLHQKLASRAIETADVGVAQMISDIHRHAIDLTTLPVTTTYALIKDPDSGAVETVSVSLNTIPDLNDVDMDGDTAEPETDLTGNIVYKIDSTSRATLANGVELVKRAVSARLSIINLASYNLFYVENDIWANGSTLVSGEPIMLDGPYHTNGNLELGGIIYFNNQYTPANPGVNNVPGATLNPSYVNTFTVMSAGDISQAGGYPGNVTYTQNNQRGRLSNDGAFSVCTTATNPRGTWFDKNHGGFEIHLEPLDFVHYRGIAQVKIDINQLPNFTVFGALRSSSDLLIDTGAGFAVDIDLSYLGTGTSKDICSGVANYQAALTSEYGLMIFVKGPVAIHGKLASVGGPDNTNKKVTVITTDTLDIIGDILYSGDSYMQVLDSFKVDVDLDGAVDGWSIDHPGVGDQTMVDSPGGEPFKNLVPAKCMLVDVKQAGPHNSLTLSKHFNIVAPPVGVDNNKVYLNIRAVNNTDATAGVTATLELIGQSGTIWTRGPIPINSTGWRRLVVVDNATSSPTLSAADIQDIASNPGENIRLTLITPDSNFRYFYVDELCFAFGRSYPIDYATVNPTNDSIALISQGNMYENAWYMYNASPLYHSNWLFYNPPTPHAQAGSIKYFAVNGDYEDIVDLWGTPYQSLYYDLRMDAFMYTSLTGSMFTVHTNRWLNMFTVYGATVSHRGGSVRAPVFNNVYDRGEPGNVSKAIPVGTVLHTYQQMK